MSRAPLLLAIALSTIESHTVDLSLCLAQDVPVLELIPSEQEELADIREVLRQFIDAWNQDDAARLVSLFTEDGAFITTQGGTYAGREKIKRMLTEEHRALFMGTTLDETVRSLRLAAVDRAVIKGDFELNGYKATFGLVSVTPEGSFVFRLRKQGDR
ncbi:MAG: SgcJ/EcaC family oxidoreductase [Nitrospira defluvii]|nr:SgcJ/EcaC family oxidoreductase [Nitrospira defluvii]